MSFFKKTSQPATTQKDSEEEIATGNFKNMTQADICACVESCRPSK